MAERFGTARGTMDAAYAILAREGYVVGRGPGGTVVSADLDSRAIAGAASRQRLSRPARGPRSKRRGQWGCPHSTRSRARSRLVVRHARCFLPVDMAYPDPAGYAPLREAIAGYLATSRGVARHFCRETWPDVGGTCRGARCQRNCTSLTRRHY
jgi:GntR family transcriptional regulator/MocR family aminotransferase